MKSLVTRTKIMLDIALFAAIALPDAASFRSAADDEGGYEASNALFAPAAGRMMTDKTVEMLSRRGHGQAR